MEIVRDFIVIPILGGALGGAFVGLIAYSIMRLFKL